MVHHPCTGSAMTLGLIAWSLQLQGSGLLVQAVPQLAFDHKDLHWAAHSHNTVETHMDTNLFFS